MAELKCTGCGKKFIAFKKAVLKKCRLSLCPSCLEELDFQQEGAIAFTHISEYNLGNDVRQFKDEDDEELPDSKKPKVSLEDLRALKSSMTETFWDDYTGDQFRDCMQEAYSHREIELMPFHKLFKMTQKEEWQRHTDNAIKVEEQLVIKCPKNKLPLLVGVIKDTYQIERLNERLKGITK